MDKATRLKVALQKSGRLTDFSTDLLVRCGLKFSRGKDQLVAFGENMPLDLLFVRDDDIPDLVEEDVCDLGLVGLNVVAEKSLELAAKGHPTKFEIVRSLDRAPEASRPALRNNVCGHLNHASFWETIGPKGGGAPSGELAASITGAFGSLDAFKSQFGDAAMKTFGSGWAWLVVSEGKLAIKSSPNQTPPSITTLAICLNVSGPAFTLT